MNWKLCTIIFFVVAAVIFVTEFSDPQPLKPSAQSIEQGDEFESPAKTEAIIERPKTAKTAHPTAPTTDATQIAEDLIASMETEAFRLAEKPESNERARELFSDILTTSPKNTLAAQMLTELSRTQADKEKTVDLIMSVFAACSSCTELGLIAADLLLELERQNEARLLSQRLIQSVKSESEQRHLVSLLEKTGDIDKARTNFETLTSTRKRLKTRRSASSPAEIIWEKIDQSELNSLTAPGG